MNERVPHDQNPAEPDLNDFLRDDDEPVAMARPQEPEDERQAFAEIAPQVIEEPPARADRPVLRLIHDNAMAEDVEDADIDAGEGVFMPGRGLDDLDLRRMKLDDNDHFLALGYFEDRYYYLNRKLSCIVFMQTGKLTQNMLLSLAPTDFWSDVAGRLNASTGTIEPDWNLIFDALYRQAESLPTWDQRREFKQGAIMDRGVPVFHTGSALHINGETIRPGDMTDGHYKYTSTISYPMPLFDDPFAEDSDEVRDFVNLLRQVDWREGYSSIAVMIILGYVALAPICGILKWRPHVWLDGPWGTGKTWFMENILTPALGQYYEAVKANSTEPGLRNALSNRAVPLLFDEAEGANQKDKERMDNVIMLARHTSSETDAKVTHAAPGGGTVRQYAVRAMFFLASITTRLGTPADKSRFARISLGLTAHTAQQFDERIAAPAKSLLTPDFSRRLVARMMSRAADAEQTIAVMTAALRELEVDQRIASVYAVFAAGSWMALRDGIPASKEDASGFMIDTFGAIDPIIDANRLIAEGRDHQVVLNEIMSAQIRVPAAAGHVTEPIGSLMRIIAGDPECMPGEVSWETAHKALINIGIRPGLGGRVAKFGDVPDCFMFRKQSPEIRKILASTPYDSNYADIMLQDRTVSLAGTVSFPGSTRERPVMVPLANLGITAPEPQAGQNMA